MVGAVISLALGGPGRDALNFAIGLVLALLIGKIELLTILQNRLNLAGLFWNLIWSLDLGAVGYIIVGLFIATWIIAFAVWKLGRIEERWHLPSAPSSFDMK